MGAGLGWDGLSEGLIAIHVELVMRGLDPRIQAPQHDEV
jgi:hypothetical protein